ncbi:MAG: RidA family protein [Nitrospinota bacterium]
MKREVLGPPSKLPFSQAIRCGDFIFLAGQIGFDTTTGKLVPGGIEAETKQTLERMKSLLEAAGSSLEKVVKATVYLADLADYAAMNEVYRQYFPAEPPTRATVQVAGLVQGARVEIEAIALA